MSVLRKGERLRFNELQNPEFTEIQGKRRLDFGRFQRIVWRRNPFLIQFQWLFLVLLTEILIKSSRTSGTGVLTWWGLNFTVATTACVAVPGNHRHLHIRSRFAAELTVSSLAHSLNQSQTETCSWIRNKTKNRKSSDCKNFRPLSHPLVGSFQLHSSLYCTCTLSIYHFLKHTHTLLHLTVLLSELELNWTLWNFLREKDRNTDSVLHCVSCKKSCVFYAHTHTHWADTPVTPSQRDRESKSSEAVLSLCPTWPGVCTAVPCHLSQHPHRLQCDTTHSNTL